MEATTPTPPDGQSVARVVKLAWVCVAVAVLVLLIDQQLKRQIVAQAERALKLLQEAQRVAREANSGTTAAGEASAGPGDSVDSDHGVDDAAGASAEPGGHAGNGLGETPGRVARPFGGVPGNE